MVVKYRTNSFLRKTIERVEIERETESSVWIGDRRRAKRSEYESYWDSWEEARSYLIEKAEGRFDAAFKYASAAEEDLAAARSIPAIEAPQ